MTYLKRTSITWVLFLGIGLGHGAIANSAHADDSGLQTARVKKTKPTKPKPTKPKPSKPKPAPAPIPGPVSGPVPPAPTPGNDAKGAEVGLYNNADGSPVIALIDGSVASLDIEIYTMDDQDVRAAIRRALGRSVRVRIVKEPDPLGACKVFTGASPSAIVHGEAASAKCADEQALVSDVTSAGGTYVAFAKRELCGGGGTNCFQHGKIVVADGRSALVSTGNFDLTNLCDTANHPSKCDRDYSVITDDATVISTLETIVAKDALGASYDVSALLTPDVAAKLTVSPFSMDPLTQFIASAKTRIQIQNQYLKDPTLNAALVAAANSGVKVELQVSSACAFGTPKPTDAKEFQAVFAQFDRAGITSSIFTPKMTIDGLPGYLHAKAIVVDGERAWVGSVNGSTESLTRNREFGVFVDDAGQVAKLSAIMASDLNDPSAESWKDSLACKMDK